MIERKEEVGRKDCDDDEETKQEIEKIDAEICKALKKKQCSEMEKELQNIHSLEKKKGSAAAVFALKKKIVGKKGDSDEPGTILDPKTNIPIMNTSEIKRVCVEYCKDLLTDREPKDDFKEDIAWKRKVQCPNGRDAGK